MSEFDSPWKEALDNYFESFVALLFPLMHHDIDWSRGYERLDKKLRQIVRDADAGGRIVDFLARVWLISGQDVWVLVHVEVQGRSEVDFGRRMFTCNYRLFDLYQRPTASLAVLADEEVAWRPAGFEYTLWETEMSFRFPSVKLIDLSARRAELEVSDNPFAVVVLAHLATLDTRKDPSGRRDTKFRLVRGLYERGMGREDVRRFFRIIDWMMDLPRELEQQFRAKLDVYEQERVMPYVTSIERLAKEEGVAEGHETGRRDGLLEGIEIALEAKFGEEGAAVMSAIQKLPTTEQLKAVMAAIRSAKSADDVRRSFTNEES